MLLREEYIAGFTHEDRVVRNTALELVTRCKAGGLDATHQALRAIESYGFDEAFLYHGSLIGLPLDEEFADKLHGLLANRNHQKAPHLCLNWLIQEAPIPFLRQRRDALLELEKVFKESSPVDLCAEKIDLRLRIASTPPPELLARLDLIPGECSKEHDSFPQKLEEEGKSIIEFLAGIPEFRNELESRANAWLALEVQISPPEKEEGEPPVFDNFWPAFFGVRIADCLRMAHTIPTLVKLLRIDSDSMNEWIAEALESMNSIHTLQAWGALYPDLEWHERLYLSGTLCHISEPGVDDFIERLLDGEDEPDLIDRLMVSLSMQPSSRATASSADFYLENEDNPEAHEIADNLYTRHILLGLDHPDLDLWRGHVHERHDRFAKNLLEGGAFRFLAASPRPEPHIAPPKTGRNDPCPCGSGKKYKKCCQPA
jgi:hypothetical protein